MPKSARIKFLHPGAASDHAPGFFRRMAACFYDALLLLAILFLATALILPLNAGQAFSSEQILYPIYLCTASFLFYGWFWVNGGQTLGLRAWRLKLAKFDGGPIGWRQAAIRFMAAGLSLLFFGLGFFWCLIDKNRLCWHDYLSGTCIFLVKREKG